jgi:lysophospholipase L1-like esterase
MRAIRPPLSRTVRVVGLIALAAILAACSEHASATGSERAGDSSAEPATAGEAWNLVVLGDSTNRPDSCDGCAGYVSDYAQAIQRQTGMAVNVQNDSAVRLSNVPGGDASALLAQILTSPSIRRDITTADIIVISIGFNDTPWGRLDDPCNAAPRFPVVHWSAITPGCTDRVVADYKHTLDEILTQVDTLRGCGEMPGVPPCSQRGARDTLIRIVTVYNATIGDTVDPGWDSPAAVAATIRGDDMMVHAQCEVARFHGGRCADIYHVMNGPHANEPAAAYLAQDYTHLNRRGHEAAAAALIKLGPAPLR